MNVPFWRGGEEVSSLEMSSQINRLYVHMTYFISTAKFLYSDNAAH
jgi:hypothetical protein